MFSLIQTGLDFDVVEAELETQIELLEQELSVTYVNEALTDLTEQHNVTTPLHALVAEITERVYEELEVLQALDEPKSMTDLQQELNRTTTDVEDIVSRLEGKRCNHDDRWARRTPLDNDLTGMLGLILQENGC